MRRIQFIEIHDQPWFPPFLRDNVTDALQYGMNYLKAYSPVGPMLRKELAAARSTAVVDLCSGGGGPWPEFCRSFGAEGCAVRVRLTDRRPNLSAFWNAAAASGDRITFCAHSVDAMKVPRELAGFRTMFSTFHHFPPEEARAVLQDAVDARQGIGIFEITRRAPSAIALMFPWSLLVFFFAPWMRPFRWSRLFWTYLVPVIPFVVLFDGVISCLRTYRPEELRDIVGTLTGNEYRWEAGEQAGNFLKPSITYLIGRPSEASETEAAV
jgi:hypothetical protein